MTSNDKNFNTINERIKIDILIGLFSLTLFLIISMTFLRYDISNLLKYNQFFLIIYILSGIIIFILGYLIGELCLRRNIPTNSKNEVSFYKCLVQLCNNIYKNHIAKHCDRIILDIIISLFSLMLFLSLTMAFWQKSIDDLIKNNLFFSIIYVFLCIIVSVIGFFIGVLWQNADDPKEIGIRLFKDIIISLFFVALAYLLIINGKEIIKKEDTFYIEVIFFLIGFLFSELISWFIKISKCLMILYKLTYRMYASTVSDLMNNFLSDYLTETQNKRIFAGQRFVGICKEASIPYLVYEEVSCELLKRARTSIYSTMVYSPEQMIESFKYDSNLKKYFEKFANASAKCKKRILVPELFTDWEGEKDKIRKKTEETEREKKEEGLEGRITKYLPKFINECCRSKTGELVKIRVLPNLDAYLSFFYGDLLIIDRKIALTFHLHKPYKASEKEKNIGTIEIITGEILKEYVKIFDKEIFETLPLPWEHYDKTFKNYLIDYSDIEIDCK